MKQWLLIFCMIKKKKTYPVYVSKRSPKFTILMIPNTKNLTVKKYQHH